MAAAADPLAELDEGRRVEAIMDPLDVLQVALEARTHVVGRALVVLCLCRHHPIWIDLREEVAAQVAREVREADVAKRLDGPHDGCRIGLEARRQLRRGQKHRSEERRVGKECRSRWSPY